MKRERENGKKSFLLNPQKNNKLDDLVERILIAR